MAAAVIAAIAAIAVAAAVAAVVAAAAEFDREREATAIPTANREAVFEEAAEALDSAVAEAAVAEAAVVEFAQEQPVTAARTSPPPARLL